MNLCRRTVWPLAPMFELLAFSILPLAALLSSAGYALWVTYRLWDWRPLLFIAVLVVMSVHQANELRVFFGLGADDALAGFGEYPETAANLLASAAMVLLLRFVARQQALAERFEDRVAERTEELESFAYSVSHDLRTPLRAINGYTRLLSNEHAHRLDDEGQRLLDVIEQSARRMGRLIDDLLALSRLSRQDMECGAVNVETLAREAYDEVCRSRRGGDDDTAFEVHSLPVAHADRSMVRQVFTNLFANALKFSRNEERPCVEVGGERQNGTTVYYVRDNGVGFDSRYADKMFGVFERLHDDTFEGTGVGLAIVERVVERHGGRVWADGEEGVGTTIFFTLPTVAALNDE